MESKMKNRDWNKWWTCQRLGKFITEFSMKHYFKNIFVSCVKKFASKNDLILELGCGSGYITTRLGKESYNVTGIDYSETAPSNYKSDNFKFILGDIRDESFKRNYRTKKFDLVYSQGVMEHYSDNEFKEILKAMTDIAKKVLIIVPSNLSIFRIYNFPQEDENKSFFGKKRLEKLISGECNGVTVKYLPATGFLSIMGFGVTKR